MNVVISGASEGIGKSIAHKFAKHQYNLFLIARDYKKLETLKQEILYNHPEIEVYVMAIDMNNKKNVLLLSEKIKTVFKEIDVLINNVGQFAMNDFLDNKEDVLEKMMEVNLYANYYLTKFLMPVFLNQNNGHIFNMCSIASLQAYNNSFAYSISKFALLGFSKNLRETLKKHNIKVTSVIPGATMSKSWEESNIDPLRIMQANDIAQMVLAASQLSKNAVVEDIILRPQLGDL